jgi:hypothetical protein
MASPQVRSRRAHVDPGKRHPGGSWWRRPRIATTHGGVSVGAIFDRMDTACHASDRPFVRSLRDAFAAREPALSKAMSRLGQSVSNSRQAFASCMSTLPTWCRQARGTKIALRRKELRRQSRARVMKAVRRQKGLLMSRRLDSKTVAAGSTARDIGCLRPQRGPG